MDTPMCFINLCLIQIDTCGDRQNKSATPSLEADIEDRYYKMPVFCWFLPTSFWDVAGNVISAFKYRMSPEALFIEAIWFLNQANGYRICLMNSKTKYVAKAQENDIGKKPEH
jgi:hypothetical protein